MEQNQSKFSVTKTRRKDVEAGTQRRVVTSGKTEAQLGRINARLREVCGGEAFSFSLVVRRALAVYLDHLERASLDAIAEHLALRLVRE